MLWKRGGGFQFVPASRRLVGLLTAWLTQWIMTS